MKYSILTWTLSLCVGIGFGFCISSSNRLVERFSWNIVDYEFPDEKSRELSISSGQFIPQHNLPLGLEVWQNKLFVTVPRWKKGVLSTLNYIDLNTQEKSPLLKPYPNLDAHNLEDGTGNSSTKIVSVFRLNVDVCDRLWVADTGLAEILGAGKQVFPPRVLLYDLKTDTLLREYYIKANDLKENSFFANIIADVSPDSCDDAYAYLADLGSSALVVYSLKENDSWRVTHHFFHFDPIWGDFHIGGINFQWNDAIFGLALSAPAADRSRTLYFHAMASTREFQVSTTVLKNKTNPGDYYSYKSVGSRGPFTQSSGSSLDEKSGILFYTLLNQNAIACWNSGKREYSADTNAIVAKDDETMIFPNDLKVDKTSNVWVLTDRLPIFLYSQLNDSDINHRIFSASVASLVKGTVCENS